jgi:hypothetical protein
MAKISVVDCPAGPALDAALARAKPNWLEMPFDRAKANPDAIKDLPATENYYVFVIDYDCKLDLRPYIYKRHFGAGDLHLWRPSGDIRVAWPLAEEIDLFSTHYLTKNEDGKYIICPKYAGFGEWPEYYEGADENVALVITRAYLKARGVTEVEVPEEITMIGGDHAENPG